VIAREADAFMKIDGEMERFAADPGSRELPMHTRSVYNSKDFSMVLALQEDTGEGEEQVSFEGSVTVRDAYGRVVYEGIGEAQCAG
jgi:hypothetical protein